MLVSDFLEHVAIRLGDEDRVTYSDQELISALNDAITQLSLERIASSDPLMVKELSVTPGTTTVPTGFVRFVGQESVYPLNGTFMSLDSSSTARTVRYFGVKPHVETKGDDLPFDDATSLGVLLNYVVVLAGARTGDQSPVEAELANRMSGAYLGRVNADANKVKEAQ
jgi:hypothetical protein